MDDKGDKEMKLKAKKKELTPGIIYLSKVPKRMHVKKMKEILSQYGDLGRTYFVPLEPGKKFVKNRRYGEGWVEFMNKKIARGVANSLNNTQVPGKRKNAWFNELWNMKYLPKFKWSDLNERQAQESEMRKKKLVQELKHARDTTDFYLKNMRRGRAVMHEAKKRKKRQAGGLEEEEGTEEDKRLMTYKQIEPETSAGHPSKRRKIDNEKRDMNTNDGSTFSGGQDGDKDKRKSYKPYKMAENKSFLKKLFSGGVGDNT